METVIAPPYSFSLGKDPPVSYLVCTAHSNAGSTVYETQIRVSNIV